jgi:NOL1/NOP2/sun family putative RNA methylase
MSDNAVMPPLFLERMSRLLGDEYAAFAAALEEQPVSGLRVNTLKLSPEAFRTISPVILGESIAWAFSGFVLPHFSEEMEAQKEPGKHPYHLAGLYYLQDPSAMSAATLLDPQPGERVLDLAASPGGKTTALAALMQGSGVLVANEIKEKRLGHLVVNMERWGAGNVVITNETPERLADHFGAWFDRVLVDAPCSGEGMFRKDRNARTDWSVEMVEGCAVRQSNILRVAGKLVRPGGTLLYSTCTFAPEEDEAIIARFLEEFPEYETISIPLFPGFMPGRPDWMEFSSIPTKLGQANSRFTKAKNLEKAVRLFPHRIQGEGHFVCLMKRAANAEGRPAVKYGRGQETLVQHDHQSTRLTNRSMGLWEAFTEEILQVDFPEQYLGMVGDRLYLVPEGLPDLRGLRVTVPGVWLGNIKKERFEPAHPLALFLRPGQARNVLDLSSKDVHNQQSGRRPPLQSYLAGETIPSDGTPGWTLVTVDGWPLGWGKRVQGIVKNHYPKGWQVYS